MIRNATHELPFLQDYERRVNPELMNRLLHRAVPVLQHTDWSITKVEFGSCESILPLNRETTNQHGTHQAALISLSADYTGGMALTTLLTGVPLSGIHQCNPEDAASLWLASMDVKYVKPSTGHLIGRCTIDEITIEKIRNRYFSGKRVLVGLPITFESNGETVAKAELKYFTQPTRQLMDCTKKRSSLFTQKIKASARMIAGVRASSTTNKNVRTDCPHATTAAGPHGILLADKLKSTLPQLTDMVHARTHHIDQTFSEMQTQCKIDQVVLLGAGLDMRTFRFGKQNPSIRFIEIDLPEMLEERERVIKEFSPDNNLHRFPLRRFPVAADFRKDDVAAKVIAETPFDSSLPTLFVYEGCSMYFSETENQKIISNIWQLAGNQYSRIWTDFVTTSVVGGNTNRPEIEAFLDQMDDLGESFVFGTDSPVEFLQNCGCSDGAKVTCREHLDSSEPIFDVYQFCVGRK